MIRNEIHYDNISAFHPGIYISDLIEDLNMSQEEFAHHLGITEKRLIRLVNGEDRMSQALANKLSSLTGVSSEGWMSLQNKYDQILIEIKNRQAQ